MGRPVDGFIENKVCYHQRKGGEWGRAGSFPATPLHLSDSSQDGRGKLQSNALLLICHGSNAVTIINEIEAKTYRWITRAAAAATKVQESKTAALSISSTMNAIYSLSPP